MSEDKKYSNVYKVCETYDCQLTDGQHPVAKVDVDIIQTLITVAYNTGAGDMGDILTSYKTLATDDQILRDLRELAARGVQGEKDGYRNKIYKDMIEINGVMIDVKFISVIEKYEQYNNKINQMSYGILINRDSTEKLFNCNTYIDCGSHQRRNDILVEIVEKLKKYTFIRIL